MPRYQWGHPAEWLESRLTTLADDENMNEILSIARDLASKVDGDALQDLFQSDMDADGYFDDLDAPTPDPRADEWRDDGREKEASE